MHFNGSKKHLGLFDNQKDGTKERLLEERILLEHLDDIYKYADRLKATVTRYEAKPGLQKAQTA
jgi:hypothetical protein